MIDAHEAPAGLLHDAAALAERVLSERVLSKGSVRFPNLQVALFPEQVRGGAVVGAVVTASVPYRSEVTWPGVGRVRPADATFMCLNPRGPAYVLRWGRWQVEKDTCEWVDVADGADVDRAAEAMLARLNAHIAVRTRRSRSSPPGYAAPSGGPPVR
ncbi:hypothetical protein [Actinomadura harenae]|uniref:Uncharacterized protein n=1 Tax=Actinomadura harenae TaxID=2483351 RepID=A0A3M2LYU9_9ACTN|nr:hypothetical protein [Actinomadura harenae]RMI42110.1 hypothetical protein EBO15_20900 [Actinomadura harenae]